MSKSLYASKLNMASKIIKNDNPDVSKTLEEVADFLKEDSGRVYTLKIKNKNPSGIENNDSYNLERTFAGPPSRDDIIKWMQELADINESRELADAIVTDILNVNWPEVCIKLGMWSRNVGNNLFIFSAVELH